eukprot:247929_1
MSSRKKRKRHNKKNQNQQKHAVKSKINSNDIANKNYFLQKFNFNFDILIANKNKQFITSYKGNIYQMDRVKYFGVLNGFSISFYLDKNNTNNIPYDCMHILKYYSVILCGVNCDELPYDVRFVDVNGNEKLAYSFFSKANCNNWYKVINNILINNKSNNDNNNNINILYNGYVLYNKRLLYFELIHGNNNLYLYNKKNTKK